MLRRIVVVTVMVGGLGVVGGCEPDMGGAIPACTDDSECSPQSGIFCIGGACKVPDCEEDADCAAVTTPVCHQARCQGTACVFEAVADNTTCDDSDSCTIDDVCVAGTCAGAPRDCDDQDACNGVETCDSALGCRAGVPIACDDGDACNGIETCDPEDGCVDGEALSCNDGNVCNGIETCDAVLGCVPGDELMCDDQDACNGIETCTPGLGCEAGTPVVCGDDNPCNGVETCNPDDGDCEPGTAPTCDDGNVCTDDACAPASGCTHANNSVVCHEARCEAGILYGAIACSNGSCPAQVATGICGDDPCDPDPCNGHGTCTVSSGGAAVCTCAAHFAGTTCNACKTGYVTYPACATCDTTAHYVADPVHVGDCIEDPCFGVDCSSLADACNATGTAVVSATGVCTVLGAGSYRCELASNPCVDGVCIDAECVTARVPSTGELVITEVMASPTVGTPGHWVELHNPTTETMVLSGLWLSFTRDSTDTTMTVPSSPMLVLDPGAYFVVGASADTGANGGVEVDFVMAGLDFDPTAGVFTVSSGDRALIDTVSWEGGWPVFTGYSISLSGAALGLAPDLLNNLPDHWCTGTTPESVRADAATPGEANPPCEVLWCNLQFPTTLSVAEQTDTAPVYGQIYAPPLTLGIHTIAISSLRARLGYGAEDSLPDDSWTWVDADFNTEFEDSNNEEFLATFTAPSPAVMPALYNYRYRMSADGGLSWTLCEGTGAMTVTDNPCFPDPCTDHGTCSLPGGRSLPAFVCTCDDPHIGGTLCDVCATGYAGYPSCTTCDAVNHYVADPENPGECIDDPCFGVDCLATQDLCTEDHGGVLSPTGTCTVLGEGNYECVMAETACTAGVCVEGECVTARAPVAGDLVINEMNADSSFGPAGTWLELHNTTQDALLLSGGSIEVVRGGATHTTTFPDIPPVLLEAHGYFVVGGNADPAQNGNVNLDLEDTGLWLEAGAGSITLKNADAATLDAVVWDATWPSYNGYSRSLSVAALLGDAVALNDAAGHWCTGAVPSRTVSADHASPGLANPACTVTWCGSLDPTAFSVVEGDATPDIYAQVYRSPVTLGVPTAPDPSVVAHVGYGVAGSVPDDVEWAWMTAGWNALFPDSPGYVANNEEYMSYFTAPTPTAFPGTFDYRYRMSADGGLTWTLCEGTGVMTVTDDPCDPDPCGDHGTCQPAARSIAAPYTCDCDENYYFDDTTCQANLTIGGLVTGLCAGCEVILSNADNGDTVTVTTPTRASGVATAGISFTFPIAVAGGSAYDVVVSAHPTEPRQHCTVTNGSGTVGSTNVTDIVVSCENRYTLGGTITGLSGTGLKLKNGDEELIIAAGLTEFTFVTTLPTGATYDVSVVAHPTEPAQTCTLTSDTGTVGTEDVTTVVVTCEEDATPYYIRGTLYGYASGTQLVLANGAEEISVGVNGQFGFMTQVPSGQGYNVTVKTQPTLPGQVCRVLNGTGTVAGQDVTDIVVRCGLPSLILLAGGSSGLLMGDFVRDGGWVTGTDAAITNHGGTSLAMNADGLGLGLVRNASNSVLDDVTWSLGSWSDLTQVDSNTTRARPEVSASGASLQGLFHGDDYHLYYMAHDDGIYSPVAEDTGSYGPIAGAVTARATDATMVFVNGADSNKFYARDRVGGTWQAASWLSDDTQYRSSWIQPSIVTLEPASTAADLLAVVVGSDAGSTQLKFFRRTGGTWSSSAAVPDATTSDPVSLVALAGGNAYLAFRGTNGQVYGTTYSKSAGTWSAVENLVATTVTGTPAVAMGVFDASLELVYVDAETGVARHKRLVNNIWSAAVDIGGTGLNAVSLARAAPSCSPIAGTSHVVISQIYGAGGTITGATYKNDFVELHNRGNVAVDLNGWSVQFANSTESTWISTNLTGTMAPGGYYLIRGAAGTGCSGNPCGNNIYNADRDDPSFDLNSWRGKLALVASTTVLTEACPSEVVDFVGFGSLTECYEGSAAAWGTAYDTSINRRGSECLDTAQNNQNFSQRTPLYRNSLSTRRYCGCTP